MYEVTYFLGAGSYQLDELDQISDRAIESYPVPIWPEWAQARHTDGSVLYGHHGEWRSYPPLEALDFERRRNAQRREAERGRAISALPHTSVIGADEHSITLMIDHQLRSLSTADLAKAASPSNSDPVARYYYHAIARAAELSRKTGKSFRVQV